MSAAPEIILAAMPRNTSDIHIRGAGGNLLDEVKDRDEYHSALNDIALEAHGYKPVFIAFDLGVSLRTADDGRILIRIRLGQGEVDLLGRNLDLTKPYDLADAISRFAAKFDWEVPFLKLQAVVMMVDSLRVGREDLMRPITFVPHTWIRN